MNTTCLAAVTAALTLAPPAGAIGNRPVNAWVTDGSVYAVAATPTQVFVGGDFSMIGRGTGSMAAIDPLRGSSVQGYPALDDHVSDVADDGSGGWYAVAKNDDVTRLVHVRADRSLDPRWTMRVDGEIDAIVRSGKTLYVAGAFRKVGGQPHAYLTAIDLTARKALPWNPRVAGTGDDDRVDVLELSRDGKTLYFAGRFASVGGAARGGIAAVATATAKVTGWTPAVGGTVYDLRTSPDGRVVYVAGDFETLDGASRHSLGAVAGTTGSVTGWNPVANGDVWAVEPAPGGSPVYVGGHFTAVGGKSRNGIAALDASAGAATGWDVNVPGLVEAILPTGKTVYFGGEFSSAGETWRPNLAAADAATGTVTDWDPGADGEVSFLRAGANDRIYAGGRFDLVGGLRREGLAALSLDGSTILPWQAPVEGTIRSLVYDPASGNVVFGGRFTYGGDGPQQSLGVVAGVNTRLLGGPFNGEVDALALGPDGKLYVGGSFTSVQGQPHNRLAVLDANGNATAWKTGANARVTSLLLAGDRLFVAGSFSSIAGVARAGLAALDASAGFTTDFDAAVDGDVNALALRGDVLYLGGEFTSVGGKSRTNLAAVSAATGAVSGWDPTTDDDVYTFYLDSKTSRLYVGGGFTTIGRLDRQAAAFDVGSGLVQSWDPEAPFWAYASAMSADGSTFYLGGSGMFSVFR